MLYAGERPILTFGEFGDLMRTLPDGYVDETLTAWFIDGEGDPDHLHRRLNLAVRLAADSDSADEIIDRALDALEGAGASRPTTLSEGELIDPEEELARRKELVRLYEVGAISRAELREAWQLGPAPEELEIRDVMEAPKATDWASVARTFAEAMRTNVQVEAPQIEMPPVNVDVHVEKGATRRRVVRDPETGLVEEVVEETD